MSNLIWFVTPNPFLLLRLLPTANWKSVFHNMLKQNSERAFSKYDCEHSESQIIHVRKNEVKGFVCWILHGQNGPAYLLTYGKEIWQQKTIKFLVLKWFVFTYNNIFLIEKNISWKHRCNFRKDMNTTCPHSFSISHSF